MRPTTTDAVLDLIESSVTSAALGAAMELGLFWLLAEQPLDAPGVAQALGMPATRCRYWLQLLGRTGLIEPVPDGYAPSAAAQAAILDAYRQETWAFLAREAREQFPVVGDLARYIREPGSLWAAQGLTPPDYLAQIAASPQRARAFTRMLYELHRLLADELAGFLDMGNVDRLLDLGGGSGVMSLALLRRYPHLGAVVVDTANVCAAGQEIAMETSAANRIAYHPADFLRDELPSGFDMVLECDVGVYSEALFAKIRAALNPGGRLVIVDQFAPAEGMAPPPRLHWAFQGSLEDPDFAFPTAATVRTQLTRAGLQFLSENTLPASESLRWIGGWVVIEARR